MGAKLWGVGVIVPGMNFMGSNCPGAVIEGCY